MSPFLSTRRQADHSTVAGHTVKSVILYGMEIYLVGGAVRDTLLGQKVSERDWVVVGAKPEEMLRRGFKQVGKQFPVFIHPKTNEEYALARTEHKTNPGYHGFAFDTSPSISIEADLKRRDLTINAIAQDSEGVLIDPWGGQIDIKMRTLRHISDAFVEDPVRVLRVARFAARFNILGFKIAPKTLALMQQMVVDGEVDYLVVERVWQETAKAFTTDHPSVYLQVLSRIGALARVAPELDTLLCRITEGANDGTEMSAHLFEAIDKAPKHLPEVLLTILSFYAHRNGVSITALGERWKLSKRCRWMIDAAERFDDELKCAADLSRKALLDFLEQADAIRNRKRFEDLLTAYRLCNYEDRYIKDDIDHIKRALDMLDTVKFGPNIKGLSGKLAKERMRKLQLDALSSL